MEHNYLKYYTIKENDIILDLGATQGDFYQELRNRLPKGCIVFCVEPEMHNLSVLNHYIFTNKCDNMVVLSGVSGVNDGYTQLVITDQAMLHHPVTVEKQLWNYRTLFHSIVPVFSLKTLIKLCGGHINFVKCDIEGSEIETFCNVNCYEEVDHLAIASYHVRDNERTWKKLQEHFTSIGYKTKVESYPDKDNQDMIYIWK